MKHTLPLFMLALACLSANTSFAQKKKKIRIYEVNDSSMVVGDTLKTNGKTFAFIESWGKHNSYYEDFKVRSASGKDLVLIRYHSFYNPYNRTVNYVNTSYYELLFFGTGQKCEVGAGSGWWNKKDIALELIRNNLIANDTINTASENMYVQINGTKYTEEQKQLYEIQKLKLQQRQNTVVQKSYIDVN